MGPYFKYKPVVGMSNKLPRMGTVFGPGGIDGSRRPILAMVMIA